MAFPAHPKDCGVCRGARRVSWCGLRRNVDGDMVADWLGEPGPCIPLPQWQAVSGDSPGGDAA